MQISLATCPIWNMGQPPMATAYIAGQLKSKGHSVRSHDFSNAFFDSLSEGNRKLLSQMYLTTDWYEHFERLRKELNLDHVVELWAEEILRSNPRLVGLSLYRSTLSVSLLLAQAVKSRMPQTTIVFGGPSCDDSRLIRRGPIDFLVHGEGEATISDLAERLETNRTVDDCPGISFLRHGEIVTTQPRPLIPDINQIPFPDFSDFNVTQSAHRVLPMLTSRGCVNRCSFCAEAPQWGKFRYRTAENIVAELQQHVARYKPHYIKMVDSLVNGSLSEFEKMCDLILAQAINVQWGGMARIHPRISREFLAKAYRAGCRHLQFGIESCSQRVLDHMRKRVKVADIERVIQDCSEAGIQVGCFFIIGYVNETEADFQANLDFIKGNRRSIADVFPGTGLHIMPGSLLHTHAEEYGIELPKPGSPADSWRTRDGSNTAAVRTERLQRFNRLIDELFPQKRASTNARKSWIQHVLNGMQIPSFLLRILPRGREGFPNRQA